MARTLFWIAVVLAVLSVTAFVATLVEPEWIEAVLRVDPDEGSGEAERGVALWVLGAAAVAFAAFAVVSGRIAWHRGVSS
ncbi:hypothetical protein P5G50_06725 [Leifsonia sp. F6_8S_P_1B]|uniref:Uncharacterized protein n=1 Tax=Leifsonia williamsii TaxID=3035919 RepID=A0ABT8KCT8_9MICO|nr:hypothetical protein [Leifsonia williamsii]MDN4614144.1 hypothetical protein [Leifsonia williamsii]